MFLCQTRSEEKAVCFHTNSVCSKERFAASNVDCCILHSKPSCPAAKFNFISVIDSNSLHTHDYVEIQKHCDSS